MLFGGKLASFLVCEKCKHVSHTYEDFNDLSLSLKPEDFAKDRKRNRLKSLAKKFGLRQDSQSDLPRSSSVPPSPNRKSFDSSADDIPAVDSRRRSHELVLSELRKIAATGDVEHVAEPEAIASDKEPSIRVDFVEPEKVKKDSDKSDDNWARLGRRISKSVGKKRKGRSMSRETKPKLKEDTPTAFDADLVAASRSNSPAITDASATADQAGILSRPTSPRLPSPSPLRESQPTSSSKRSKSPPPPKLSREETAYLRHILADVAPASAHHFALFRPASASSAGVTPINGHSLWTKLSQLPGIEECLRWFTSVEMLDGENMVGCRRCWKMANGVYKDRPVTEDRSDSEEENDGSPVSSPVDDIFTPAQTSLSASNVAFTPDIQSSPELDRNPSPASASALSITGDPSLLSFGETAPSASSLPTTIESTKILKKAPPPMPLDDIRHDESPVGSPQSHPDSYVGLPIPLISTTAPESPMSQPNTAKTVVPRSMYSVASASLSAPRVMRRHPQKRFNGDSDVFSEASSDSFDETESEASQSDASSMGSPFVSPNASHERFHTRSPAFTNSTNGDNPPKLPPRLLSKVPRSKQIIMRRCYKRYLISEPPPVLVIHLKRFQQTSKNPMMSSFSTGFKKLDDYVTFPENLDLTPFLAPKKEDFGLSKKGKKSDRKSEKPPCMYRLYAVVVHIGNMVCRITLWHFVLSNINLFQLGGHYIAYTALSDSGHSSAASIPASEIGPQTTSDASIPHIEAPTRQWAYISDTAVRLTTLDEVLKSKAYLCMYERIS